MGWKSSGGQSKPPARQRGQWLTMSRRSDAGSISSSNSGFMARWEIVPGDGMGKMALFERIAQSASEAPLRRSVESTGVVAIAQGHGRSWTERVTELSGHGGEAAWAQSGDRTN